MQQNLEIKASVTGEEEIKRGAAALRQYATDVKQLVNDVRLEKVAAAEAVPQLEKLAAALTRVGVSNKQSVDATRLSINAFSTITSGSKGLTDQMMKMETSVRQGNAAMLSITRVFQDAPFGMMGITNNLQMLSEQFAYLSKTSGGAGAAIKVMVSQLTNPMVMGPMIFSAITSIYLAIQMMGDKAKKTKDEAKELYDVLEKISALTYKIGGDTNFRRQKLVADLDAAEKEQSKLYPYEKTVGTTTGLRTRMITPVVTSMEKYNAELKVKEARNKLDEYDEKVQSEIARDIERQAEAEKRLFEERKKARAEQLRADKLYFLDPRLALAGEKGMFEKPFVSQFTFGNTGTDFGKYTAETNRQQALYRTNQAMGRGYLGVQEPNYDPKEKQKWEEQQNKEAIEYNKRRVKQMADNYGDMIKEQKKLEHDQTNAWQMGMLHAIQGVAGAMTTYIGGALDKIFGKSESLFMVLFKGVISGFVGGFSGGLANSALRALGFDSGGWVNEPVIGMGMKSKRAYTFAENNPEYVVNPNKLQSGTGLQNMRIEVVGKLRSGDIFLSNKHGQAMYNLSLA
jgi:hypothetical protein